MLKRLLLSLGIVLISNINTTAAQEFQLARLHYHGGGDWYADPSSLPNLIRFAREHGRLALNPEEARVTLTDPDLYQYPILYMTGHGNVRFSQEELQILRDYLTSGGFLFADDCYGMDKSFRRELKRLFPKKELVELPPSHPIFHIIFDFPNGLPKIHEHDGLPPQALALFHHGRMIVLYTYQTDLGDGWEDLEVHNDGPKKHREALEMGTNILAYVLSQ